MNNFFAKSALLSALIASPFKLAFAAEGDTWSNSELESEAEIPEPMVFDLVRRLNSHKGEYEFNSLFRFEGIERASGLLYAPEFEYAFADGFAGELELPVADGQLDSIKVALQSKIGQIKKGHLENGVQVIYEHSVKNADKEISLLSIQGMKFSPKFAFITIIGGLAHVQRERTDWGVLANGTLFYNNSREIDFAIETNYRKVENEPSELKLIPQFHLLFAKDVKVQLGVGAILVEGQVLAMSAFRTIWEFNE